MKRRKIKYNRKFNVNNCSLDFELISRCVTHNPQEKSYRSKLCTVIFSDTVKDNSRERIRISFKDMRAAAVFISNHIDADILKLNIFGKRYFTHLTTLSCNYKLYTIYSIDNKDVWETFIESSINED